jgi:predicted phage terminase large subunit-like protein
MLSDDVKPAELKQKYINGLLDVNRLDAQLLSEIKAEIGTRNFNAQIMQSPSNESDSIVKRGWFRIEFEEANNVNLTRHYFIDSAYGLSDGDYNALLSCYVANNTLYVDNLLRTKDTFPDLINTIKGFVKPNPQSKVYLEAKASGLSIIQTLKSTTNFNILELKPKDSKLIRLTAVAPLIEAGRVVLIRNSWNDDLIEEMVNQSSPHDDAADVLVYAIETLLIKDSNYGKYHINSVRKIRNE